MKEKIGIFFLGLRRMQMLKIHLPQLAKTRYKDFHFYCLYNEVGEETISLLKKYLPDRCTIVTGFDSKFDYMSKIQYALSCGHEYSVKMDEDCFMLAESWDRFFSLIEGMKTDDLFCTGAISNGIPTCDMFVKNFIPSAKVEIDRMFSDTKFHFIGGVDYSPLNTAASEWDSDTFFTRVWNLNHYYKGIHPVRVNLQAAASINDHILRDPIRNMTPIDSEVIRDTTKYPYFCNSFFGIRTDDWKNIVSRRDLFVDPFEEVPLNKYRHETKRNMVIDTGIPILHTMYNWSQNWSYEENLINRMIGVYATA
jgi:hypothetical protein